MGRQDVASTKSQMAQMAISGPKQKVALEALFHRKGAHSGGIISMLLMFISLLTLIFRQEACYKSKIRLISETLVSLEDSDMGWTKWAISQTGFESSTLNTPNRGFWARRFLGGPKPRLIQCCLCTTTSPTILASQSPLISTASRSFHH